MKYVLAGVVAVGVVGAGGAGWWHVTQGEMGDGGVVVSEHEGEFEGGELGDRVETSAAPEGGVVVYDATPTTTTYLPPIPEPMNDEGRTRWAAYWEPMTPEEYAVYGPRDRAPGPARVGIQVGHWQRDNLPEELAGLTGSTGALAGGYTEEEVNLAVARAVVARLSAAGVEAELLPVTVPVDYLADAFISIHADGSTNPSVSGFKIAPPRTDFSGRAPALVAALYEGYEAATSLPRDDAFTRRMSGYYAFNWRRYDHAIHPQTPAAIVEMGFLTNAADRALMVQEPVRLADGIADGILAFLRAQQLVP